MRRQVAKGSCAVYVDLQAVGVLEFFGELLKVLVLCQHFAVSIVICRVPCPPLPLGVDKPLTIEAIPDV